jgi:hypothetical protein
MTTFQWVIPQDSMITAKTLDGLNDVVVTVNAYREATDDIYSTQYSVSLGLTPPTEGFIPYQDLTKEIVEGWLNSGLPVDEIDVNLEGQLYNIINPKTVVLPLPWETTTTTTTTTETPVETTTTTTTTII